MEDWKDRLIKEGEELHSELDSLIDKWAKSPNVEVRRCAKELYDATDPDARDQPFDPTGTKPFETSFGLVGQKSA